MWSAVYTIRNNKIRIISVRKSRENEKEIYFSS
ncbi:BrnT family toxin [Lunatimonas lonarensis]